MNDLQMSVVERESASTIVDPEAVVDLMVALERVFKIGVYYPSGHAMCDQAADLFLRALIKVVAKAPALRFECGRDTLSVQGFELDPALRGVRGFRELLNEVGVSAIDIDSTVTAADLHRFVMQMLAYRNRIRGAHDFQQVIIEGMPPTVTVEHLEFVARDLDANDAGGPGGLDSANPSLEALLATLLKHGLTPQEMARCRRLLEAVPGYLQANRFDGVALPQVSWLDVEKLLLRAAKQPAGGPDDGSAGQRSPSANLDALAAIFAALGEKEAATDPRQAIDLLVALSRRTPPAAEPTATPAAAGAAPSAAKPAPTEEPSLVELRAAMAACAEMVCGGPLLGSEHRGELITILVQFLQRDQKPQVQLRIQKQLRDILRTPMQPAERQITVDGVRHLLGLGDPERLHGALRIVLEALRSSEHGLPLGFLCDVVRGRPREDLLALWPFLVNELLLTGGRQHEETFAEACAAVIRPTPAEMEAGLPVLETLESLRDRRCARDVFAPPPTALYPVFATLLHSPHAPFIGDQLLSGLRYKPLSWLSEAVMPLLGRFQPKHRRFLIEILELGDRDEIPAETAESAGKILAEALPRLPRENRREPWVPVAVGAVARLPVPGGAEFLREVQHSRRFLVAHEWPDSCRRAAREARTAAVAPAG